MLADDKSQRMRQEIMLAIKANGLTVTGEFWLMLVFRTDEELASICRELNINTSGFSNVKGSDPDG